MEDKPTNPYQAPGVGELLMADAHHVSTMKPPLPPIGLFRMVVGLVAITVGCLLLGTKVYGITYRGVDISLWFMLCMPALPSRLPSWLCLGAMAATYSLMIYQYQHDRILPSGNVALAHSIGMAAVWIISCGFSLGDWRKRRNNPQPEFEVDPVAFSQWKRKRRLGIRE